MITDRGAGVVEMPLFTWYIGETWRAEGHLGYIKGQGPHCTGKTGKMAPKIVHVRENTGNFEIMLEHRENSGKLYVQVVSSLILKM